MIEVNSIVSRKSYDNDVSFRVYKIENDVAYLKGCDIRLYADAPLSDLVLCERNDTFKPEYNNDNMNRDEYFYLPAKIVHLDSDPEFLNRCLEYYRKCGVMAIGKVIKENELVNEIDKLLEDTKPDILVITGHDSYFSKKGDINDINNYKNSIHFINCVKRAREYEKSHEKLVIIAGACQSDYEDLIKSGANYASSPKRINIHALDPAIIAVNIAKTEKDKKIDIKELLSKTKYGKYGIGGIVGKGMMYIGYPR